MALALDEDGDGDGGVRRESIVRPLCMAKCVRRALHLRNADNT